MPLMLEGTKQFHQQYFMTILITIIVSFINLVNEPTVAYHNKLVI